MEPDEIIDYPPNPDGSFKREKIIYFINDEGQKIKRIETYMVRKEIIRVNKRVEARKKWTKFGQCAGVPPGLEPGITFVEGELTLVPSIGNINNEEEPVHVASVPQNNFSAGTGIKCRNCGQLNHWTKDCPNPSQGTKDCPNPSQGTKDCPNPSQGTKDCPNPFDIPNQGSQYIPPHLRKQTTENKGNWNESTTESDNCNIRITNLSEDITKDELQDLFSPFGRITRITLLSDRNMAFINYKYPDEAQKAIDKMNGQGLNHLIIAVELAKNKRKF